MSSANLPRIDGLPGRFACRRSLSQHFRWDVDVPNDLVERIWQDPHALLADGDKLQEKPRSTVVRLDHDAGTFVWKHHNWGSLYRATRKSLARSTARKAWIDGHFLHAAGLPTPRPRAFLERRLGPFRTYASYLLTDYVAGTSLYRLMRFERPSPQTVRHLARQVAAIWQKLDALCVWHNDFKPENLLVDPQGKVWLIDLERMRRFKRPERMRLRQVKDARDLLHPRNWRSDPAAAEIFRREILHTPAATATLAGPHGEAHPLKRPLPVTNMPSQLVSVLIPCRNAADSIVACIESVRDMADEILVADAGSTDDTLRLVRGCGGCRIIQQPSDDDVAFETWAQLHARHPWILRILPGEELNSELGRQVQDTLAREPAELGYRISRSIRFHGRRLRYGGYADESSIRLYRKDAARFELRGGRVEVVIESEKIGRLPGMLDFESCRSVEHLLGELLRWATRSAHDDQAHGLGPRRRTVLWSAPWRFFYSYIVRGGWMDGWPGLHASCLSAFAVYLRETMLWEMHAPNSVRRALARDQWQKLRVFDPQSAAESANEAFATIFELPASDNLQPQQVRSAA